MRSDNEKSLGKAFPAWINRNGLEWLPTPTYTHEPNGGVERAGGVIIRKSTTIRIAARLPENYWPEATTATAYLHNLTPV